MEDYKTALSIFKRALGIRNKLKDFGGIASTTNNIAFSYLKLGEIKKAKEGFMKALGIYKRYHDRHGEAVVMNNLG